MEYKPGEAGGGSSSPAFLLYFAARAWLWEQAGGPLHFGKSLPLPGKNKGREKGGAPSFSKVLALGACIRRRQLPHTNKAILGTGREVKG